MTVGFLTSVSDTVNPDTVLLSSADPIFSSTSQKSENRHHLSSLYIKMLLEKMKKLKDGSTTLKLQLDRLYRVYMAPRIPALTGNVNV